MSTPVTYLFVPGNRPDRFGKALASGADAVIVDFEEAVPDANKDTARQHAAAWVRALPERTRILVRVNAAGSAAYTADRQIVAAPPPLGVILGKTGGSDVKRVTDVQRDDGFVIPLIESACGIANVSEIASAPRVQRLAFGALD